LLKLFRNSWSLSIKRPKFLQKGLKQPHAKISFGFWFRVTVDDYVPQPLPAAPVRPWESRIWTIPEAVLSQRAMIQCGENTAKWTNDLQELCIIRVRVKSAVVSPQWKTIFQGKEIDISPFLDLIKRHSSGKLHFVTIFRSQKRISWI